MLTTAIAAARAAGEIQSANYGTLLNVDHAKRNDIKLEVDRLSEEAIIQTIRDQFPDHKILAEERGEEPGTAPYRWIIDPLDGTVNFFYGIPYFCTSIACYRMPETPLADTFPRTIESLGTPVVAAIYMPLLDEMFAAEKGKGATLNEKPIHASSVDSLADSIIASGFGSTNENIHYLSGCQCALVKEVRKVRCLGASAYDLANVAAGRITGYYERGIRSWDIAAGRLILEEAGGVISASEYAQDTWDVVATAQNIHTSLVEAIGFPKR